MTIKFLVLVRPAHATKTKQLTNLSRVHRLFGRHRSALISLTLMYIRYTVIQITVNSPKQPSSFTTSVHHRASGERSIYRSAWPNSRSRLREATNSCSPGGEHSAQPAENHTPPQQHLCTIGALQPATDGAPVHSPRHSCRDSIISVVTLCHDRLVVEHQVMTL